MGELISLGDIQDRIFKIRGQSVMLDRHLAALYGMRTIALRQQVRRNMDHFPEDFAFQLTRPEAALLVSQRCEGITTTTGFGGTGKVSVSSFGEFNSSF